MTRKDPARMTIENCEKIARKFIAAYGGSMKDAMAMAEFNLKAANNVSEVLKRIDGPRKVKRTNAIIKVGTKVEHSGMIFTTISVRGGVCTVRTESGFTASMPLTEAIEAIESGNAKVVA